MWPIFFVLFGCFCQFAHGDRPGCPPINPNIRCIVYNQQCNSDKDCDKGELCCFQPSCGTSCQKRAVSIPDPRPQCPPYRKDVKCKRYDKQCIGDKDCKFGQTCCRVACGTACKPSSDCLLPKKPGPCKAYFPRYYYDSKKKSCQKFIYCGCQGNANNFKSLEECERKCNTEPEEPECPPVCEIACKFGNVLDKNGCPICKCKPDPCQSPPCAPPPPNVCTEPQYRIIDGVKCPWCYKIVPCKPNKKPPGPPSPPPTTTPLPPAATKPPQKKCPADPLPNAKCYQHTRICTDDSDCKGHKKCCRYGCYNKCLDPL